MPRRVETAAASAPLDGSLVEARERRAAEARRRWLRRVARRKRLRGPERSLLPGAFYLLWSQCRAPLPPAGPSSLWSQHRFRVPRRTPLSRGGGGGVPGRGCGRQRGRRVWSGGNAPVGPPSEPQTVSAVAAVSPPIHPGVGGGPSPARRRVPNLPSSSGGSSRGV